MDAEQKRQHMHPSADPVEREAAVIVAAWRIIAQQGLSGRMVRAVAAEAGVVSL